MDKLIKCPKCEHESDDNGFDVLGACGANLFCTQCHCEFEPGGEVHDARKCKECIKRRKYEREWATR